MIPRLREVLMGYQWARPRWQGALRRLPVPCACHVGRGFWLSCLGHPPFALVQSADWTSRNKGNNAKNEERSTSLKSAKVWL